MIISEAIAIAELLESSNHTVCGYEIKTLTVDDHMVGFHQWVDYKEISGAYFVNSNKNENLYLFLIDWREEDDYYIVLYPENKSGPIAELHTTLLLHDDLYLKWKYKPMKRDGRNPERKLQFEKFMLTTDILLKLPQKEEDLKEFLDELFTLARNRVAADGLSVINDDEQYYDEGRTYLSIHKSYERNTQLIKMAKRNSLKRNGKLMCEVCRFCFEDYYGEIGKEYIEAHHKIPLSELGKQTKIKVDDLALLCSNCHKMIHGKKRWLTLDELSSNLRY